MEDTVIVCDFDLFNAILFAAEKHKHQIRKGTGESFITHPLGVVKILIDSKCKAKDILMAAVLHDTIEDTDASFDEIKLFFGEKVASIVMEVTDDKSLPKVERKKLQIEHAKSSSYTASLIKLADKIYNLSDLLKVPPKGWTNDDIRGYFLWSKEVIEAINSNFKEKKIISYQHKFLRNKLNILFDTKFPESDEYIIPKNKEDYDKFLKQYYEKC